MFFDVAVWTVNSRFMFAGVVFVAVGAVDAFFELGEGVWSEAVVMFIVGGAIFIKGFKGLSVVG